MKLSADKTTLRYKIDYPANGPSDIYALGVPRNVPLDDRMPTPVIANVLRALEQGRDHLDNYLGMVTTADSLITRIVRRKGDRWRVDLCSPNATFKVEVMPKDSDPLDWWRGKRKTNSTRCR